MSVSIGGSTCASCHNDGDCSHPYLMRLSLRISCLIWNANLVTPRSLKCSMSLLKSSLTTLCFNIRTLLYFLISSRMPLFTSSIFLFSCGLSYRCGIWHMIIVLLCRFREMLLTTFLTSSTQSFTGCASMLLLPADNTVMSLFGMDHSVLLICLAVLPGKTKPSTL